MATIKSYSDLEQSRKLADILPLESADMYYPWYIEDDGDTIESGHRITTPNIGNFITYKVNKMILPCWSLAALLGVIKEQGNVDLRFLQSTFDNRGERLTNVWCCTFEDIGTVTLDLYSDNPVDACYEMVIRLNELKML